MDGAMMNSSRAETIQLMAIALCRNHGIDPHAKVVDGLPKVTAFGYILPADGGRPAWEYFLGDADTCYNILYKRIEIISAEVIMAGPKF